LHICTPNHIFEIFANQLPASYIFVGLIIPALVLGKIFFTDKKDEAAAGSATAGSTASSAEAREKTHKDTDNFVTVGRG
jgi:hypothetical protein